MKQKKRYLIFTMLALISVLSIAFIKIDWSSFFYNTYDINNPVTLNSSRIKLLVSLLSAFIVILIKNDGINKKDTQRLNIIYCLIFFADFNFYINNPKLAIVIFGVVQSLLILRNGTGLRGFFKSSSTYDKLLVIFSGIIVFIVLSTLFRYFLYPYITSKLELYALSTYGFLVGYSFFIAWVSLKVRYFPIINSILVAIGMTFFLLCDFTVGVTILLNHDIYRTIASYLTWVFYTPALVLIALSGYKLTFFKNNN